MRKCISEFHAKRLFLIKNKKLIDNNDKFFRTSLITVFSLLVGIFFNNILSAGLMRFIFSTHMFALILFASFQLSTTMIIISKLNSFNRTGSGKYSKSASRKNKFKGLSKAANEKDFNI